MIKRQLEAYANLQNILARKRVQLAKRKAEVPVDIVREQARQQVHTQDVPMVLRNGRASLIVDVKRTTTDGKVLMENYDPAPLAQMLQNSGAEALFVTTDEDVPYGGLEHLTLVKYGVAVPVLRQDFIFDDYQIIEARAAGADGVRLIAGILNDVELRNLLSLTQRMRMSALVEVHNQEELERVLPLTPRLIGINHRDMHTNVVDLELTAQLRDSIPPHITVVSQSGISTVEQVRTLVALKVDAYMVGEAVLTADDIGAKIRELTAI